MEVVVASRRLEERQDRNLALRQVQEVGAVGVIHYTPHILRHGSIRKLACFPAGLCAILDFLRRLGHVVERHQTQRVANRVLYREMLGLHHLNLQSQRVPRIGIGEISPAVSSPT